MAQAAGESIRQLLNRRDLASARHRAAMSRRLGLSDSEMLAVAHLAQHGRLSPSALAQLLDLSSGGITALVQRLESAGHLVRRRHPTDRRSVLVELSAELVARAEREFGPLVDGPRAREPRAVRRGARRSSAASSTARSRSARTTRERALAEPERAEPATAAPAPGLWG